MCHIAFGIVLSLFLTMIQVKSIIDKIKAGSSVQTAAEWVYENDPSLDKPCFNTYIKSIERLLKKHKTLEKSKHRSPGLESFNKFLEAAYIFPVKLEPSELDLGTATKQKLQKELTLEREKFSDALRKIEHLEQTQIDQNKIHKRTLSRENYYREKVRKLEENTSKEQVQEFQKELATLQETQQLKEKLAAAYEQIQTLTIENDKLNESLSNTVVLFDQDKNRFTSDLQKCVYTLLENHVGSKHVAPVIEACMELCNKSPDRLPSSSTVDNMNLQRLALSQQQITEFSQQKNTTLHTDETSKFGTKYGSFSARNSDGRYYVLGLREMLTKSAADTLSCFKDILSDIDDCISNKLEQDVSKKLLVNIRNTMSDRAATECKFNELLFMYRKECLPQIIQNFNDLNASDQEALSSMNNFFCGLHTLVHMAETCRAVMSELEDSLEYTESLSAEGSDGNLINFIYITCKAFARGADEKSGCHGLFVTWLTQDHFLKVNGFKSLPLVPYRGNRFNILFCNAGYIFFLRNKMLEFLKSRDKPNRLLQLVLKGLQDKTLLAGIRALGLMSKLVTTPLWNVLENKDIHILKMTDYYSDLIQFLEGATTNILSFMSGEMEPFSNIPIKKDSVYQELTTSSEETDSVTETILLVLLPALAKLLKSEFSDFLPGGKFREVADDSDMAAATASVEAHNKFAERTFGYLDQLLRFKPNVSTIAVEAYAMFSFNKTNEWLNQKSEDEQEKLLHQARTSVKELRQKFKIRKQKIQEQRLAMLQEQAKKMEERRLKQLQELEKQTEDIVYYGLWQTNEQIHAALSAISSVKEKEEAVKAQLRFRRNLLKQAHPDKDVYIFSSKVQGKRKNKSLSELTENLKKLISTALANTSNVTQPFLVGKKVRHKFEVSPGNKEWYIGHIISQVPGYSSWYNVVYETDKDTVYTYDLEKDYSNNDLEIIATTN